MSMTSHYLPCAGREMHYTEWGAQHQDVVIAWHGLARTGRDMDELAVHLSERADGYRVICPDTIGRGLSQWSPLLSPDRWLLWLGVLFVLSVYYFPTGVVGRLRAIGVQGTTGKA